jgi:hypothetical protein
MPEKESDVPGLSRYNGQSLMGLQKAIQESVESYQRIADTFSSIVPNLPEVKLPEKNDCVIPVGINPALMTDQNNWERHSELLEVQHSNLKVLELLLSEQRDGSKITKRVFWLTIASVAIAAVGLVISLIYK